MTRLIAQPDLPLAENSVLLKFQALKTPISLVGCAEIFSIFNTIFRDLEITEIDGVGYPQPLITIEKTESGYRRNSPWLDRPVTFPDDLDAACDCSVDLIHAFVADNPGYLCLHTAAARFKRGLVLFPSFYRTGKSTLSVHLASSGVQLFTDDALPITEIEDKALALGIYPRLRLPLPENTTPEFQTFVGRRKGYENKRSCYIQLKPDELASFDTMAAVFGIVVLNRIDSGAAKLESEPKDEVIKEMILRNFARQNPALDIVDRICAIVEKAKCYKLTYSNLSEATQLLKESFY